MMVINSTIINMIILNFFWNKRKRASTGEQYLQTNDSPSYKKKKLI